MSNVTSLAALRDPQPHALQPATSVQAGFFDLQSFELMQRVAKGFASSTLVPQQYQGNVANTMIALSMAQRIGADPMAVMQQLYIVHGRPSWSSKFLIATFNACGRFTSMRFRFKGDEGADDWSCQAYATEKATGEEVNGSWVSIGMAKAEGWYGKNGSKWKTMPQHMLMYRAASFMVNTVAPELSMGLGTVEETHDIIDVSRQDDGGYAVTVETLREPTPAKPALTQTTDPHPTAENEANTPDWPQPHPETGELVDVRGIPWDERCHASSRACNDDGKWRARRGADPDLIRRYEGEALARLQAPAETAPEPQGAMLEPDAPDVPSDFEKIRNGLLGAANEDEILDWWSESQNCVISQSQRYALESARDERRRQLSAQAA